MRSLAFGGHEANVGGGWRYIDERWSQVVTTENNRAYALPAYDVVDLHADVQFDSMTAALVCQESDRRARLHRRRRHDRRLPTSPSVWTSPCFSRAPWV